MCTPGAANHSAMANKNGRSYLEHGLTADEMKALKRIAVEYDASVKELTTWLIANFLEGRLIVRET
jgi:hypothetical protein